MLLDIVGGDEGCERDVEGCATEDVSGKGKGPSKALAGDGDRDPGIGVSGFRGMAGEDRKTVSRIRGEIDEVSHVSKAESVEVRVVVIEAE